MRNPAESGSDSSGSLCAGAEQIQGAPCCDAAFCYNYVLRRRYGTYIYAGENTASYQFSADYDNYGSGKCLQRNNYKDFFENSIPAELQEAAELDGCSHFRYFLSIVLPLSKAVISVITLYYAVGHWNDFFNALLYLNKDEYQPLQTILRNILISNQAMAGTTGAGEGSYAQQYADQIKFAVIIVSTVPVLCIYPFIQKYFEKGVMIGAVKG